MAGTDSTGAFSSSAFRAAIRATMTMGLPNASADQATFRWTTKSTYSGGKADPSNHPYDWSTAPLTNTSHADVQVPCAVEFQERNEEGTIAGPIDASRAIITVLDVDWALIAGADQVILGQNIYDIQLVAPPVGLFDVTVYTIYAMSRDATNRKS